MCGVMGIIPESGEIVPDEARLRRSAEILEHRGPDSQGIRMAGGVGLVHTRLALLDLSSRSAQPFWDDTGDHCIVYNGEVYNFSELRAELETNGVEFRTTSDTEVVLRAILRWGAEAAARRFEGMFALALWSKKTGELILARDRFGIKPLFVAEDGGRFLFASEVEGLRPWMPLRPDLRTLFAFLYGSGGPMDGQTFFEKIDHLPPGTILRVTPGKGPSITRYAEIGDLWDVEINRELESTKDEDLVDEVEVRLARSIDQQMIADARVGVLCSGGVDSSLILALAARTHDDLAVFHADVVGPTSEREAAHALADHLGLDLQAVEVVDNDFLELLPELTRHHGSPFHLNPHSVPFYRVSQLVREAGVKAVLSGEGADEAFLGYPWLAPGRTSKRVAKAAHNPSRTASSPAGELVTAMLEGFHTEREHHSNQSRVAGLRSDEQERALQTLDLLQANLRGLLHRNDTMGMAASIESRFPFLDTSLVRLAINLPPRAKIRRGFYPRDRRHPLAIDKWVIRKLADRHLPTSLSRRPKVPFATTAYGRMTVRPGLFRDGFLDDVVGLDEAGWEAFVARADQRLRSKLVHLETWGRVMIRNDSDDDVLGALKSHVTIEPH